MHTQQAFAPDGRSVAEARTFVRQALDDWGADDLMDEVVLATSELVTNAVVHAGTPVRIALDLDPTTLRLEVQDLHPHRPLPLGVEVPEDESEHGRGLFITAALASTWGVDYTAGTKRVWITLRRGEDRESSPGPARTRRTGAEATGLAVLELSAQGEVTSWNDDAVLMFGWSAEEVLDEGWSSLVQTDPAGGSGSQAAAPDWTTRRWRGPCTIRGKSGPVEVFAQQISGATGTGSVVVLVPLAERALLEAQAAEPRRDTGGTDPLGLSADTLSRLGLEAYLDLVVERTRDVVAARAAYLMVSRDADGEFEVATVSGLDPTLRGMRLAPGEIGAPDPRNPRLPVLVDDLADVETSWVHEAGLRSIALAPIVMEDRVVGALVVASERVAGFSDEEAVLLHRVAAAVAPAADRARLRVAERQRRGWLTFLAEAADLLAGSLDQDMTMAITGQIVVPQLACWCALYLDDERGEAVLHQVWHRDERSGPELRSRLDDLGPRRLELLPGSVHEIVLLARGRRIGVLVLGRGEGDPLQGEARAVAESVARRAALAIDNARAHGELQAVGEALQRSLLPASVPTPVGFDVGVVYEAAGEASLAGGDFYDLFAVSGGRWWFAVGDVCGTGAQAAAVTGLARHTIRALARTGFPVAATLERLNEAIIEEGDRSRFLTLVAGTLKPRADGGLGLSLVCAGHPSPFLVRRTGEIFQVGRSQPLLGVLDRVAFVAEEHVLRRGDLMVAVTDGVLERREGLRMLEERGLMEELARVGDLTAQAVAERVRTLVAGFAATPQRDDMAVLVVRAPGAR